MQGSGSTTPSASFGSSWLEMTPSEKYTAAAYLVVFVGLLAYVLIMASKLQRIQRDLGDLVERLRQRESADD